MRFAIAYSRLDKAGVNIVKELKKTGFIPQIPIIELKKETIYSDELNPVNYPELRNIDFIIFASRHKSEKGNPSLSLHAPGNWRGADFGGKPGKLCTTSAFVLKYLFQELNKNAQEQKLEGYEVTMEVTHHGPLIETPCCFIELGSSEAQWSEEKPAKVLAKTILSLQNYKENKEWIACIAVGGLHYMQSFNKLQLNSKYAIGHAIPKYCFPVTTSMLKEAEQKAAEHIIEVVLDWKGCGKSEERQKTINLLNQLGFNYKRTNNIK